ncbi:MAG: hypothetical protein ACUVX8_01125 [Candidatus Zipacnadales bacterium]
MIGGYACAMVLAGGEGVLLVSPAALMASEPPYLPSPVIRRQFLLW